MILATTSTPVAFTPAWQVDLSPRPVYWLRAGSVVERATFEADLAGDPHRCGQVWPHELRSALIEALTALGGEDRAALVELVDREQAAAMGDAASALTGEEQALLDAVRGEIERHWPEYAALRGQMQRRDQLLPVLAFQRFCTGWDNVGAEFALDRGRVADAAMSAVPPFALRAAGIFAYSLLYAGPSAEKNLSPPSALNGSRPNSPSGARSRAGGKSATGTGRKTPR